MANKGRNIKKKQLHGLSPRANYTDRAGPKHILAKYRISNKHWKVVARGGSSNNLDIRGKTWPSALQGPTVATRSVFLVLAPRHCKHCTSFLQHNFHCPSAALKPVSSMLRLLQQVILYWNYFRDSEKKKKNLYGLSPRANYADWATTACRRS
jgi:hypothetical protein